MPGAFAFLTFQRDRGTEVESLGALVFHVARQYGWDGQVLLNYGSVEFLGPYVGRGQHGRPRAERARLRLAAAVAAAGEEVRRRTPSRTRRSWRC